MYEAIHLRDRLWAIRPAGQLGTCGFHPFPWTVIYVYAGNAAHALLKAARYRTHKG